MKSRLRFVGLLAVLVLALVLVPVAAMAATPVTQGVQGTVKDATTGMGIPFASIGIQVDGGDWAYLQCEYDGTYRYATPVSADVRIHAGGFYYNGTEEWPIVVTAGAVTTQDFSLDRGEMFKQPIYRFFNMKGGVHFYTASNQEFMNVYSNLSDVFHYDGVAYFVPWGAPDSPNWINPNTFPLYRFFNRHTGVHFYTMSEAEKANVMATRGDDYTFEGVAYWVSDSDMFADFSFIGGGGFPVYRFYVPSRDAHFFTADSGEIFGPLSRLSDYYHYEGIGFYINDWQPVNPGIDAN